MSTNIQVSKEKIIIEIDIEAGPWRPGKGQLVYKPDILSVSTPVIIFEWTDSAEDYALLYENLVFRTKEEALDEYYAIRAIRRFVRA